MTIKYKLNFISDNGNCQSKYLNCLNNDCIVKSIPEDYKILSVSRYDDNLIANHISLAKCGSVNEALDRIQLVRE